MNRTELYKCTIYVSSGQRESFFIVDLPKYIFTEECEDVDSQLYQVVCDKYPDNNWDEIVCDGVLYCGDKVNIYISTY